MYVYIFLVSYIKKEGSLAKAHAFPHSHARTAQPFYAHARYFFSLDSSSAEMQCAVAAIRAGMAAAAMCDAAVA